MPRWRRIAQRGRMYRWSPWSYRVVQSRMPTPGESLYPPGGRYRRCSNSTLQDERRSSFEKWVHADVPIAPWEPA
jgi:hypothetical protein